MTDPEIEKIADRLFEKMSQRKKDFWIEPEQHYLDHEWLGGLRRSVGSAVATVSKVLLVATAGGIIWLISMGKGIK